MRQRPQNTVQTMQELADYVGLSRQTISKFFNDPDTVSKKNRERIKQAIRITGFQPNLFARNLKRNKSKVIGIIIPSMIDPFFMKLASKISNMAEAAGYFTFTLSSHANIHVEAEAIGKLQSMNAAGALVVPLGTETVQSELRRLEKTMSIVYIDTQPTHLAPFVGTDNRQSVTEMVKYLCATGAPPAFLAMPPINQNALKRQQAYIDAMENLKEQPEILHAPTDTGWQFEQYGHFRTTQWLSQKRTYRTLFCANDRLAYGALLATWKAGINIGRGENSIRIAGHDDHPLAAYTCPPLTTIAQNDDRIAKTALDMLLMCIKNEQTESPILIPAKLVQRDSA